MALLATFVACGDEGPGGPHARVRRFSGCEVPAGSVRVHEQVGGGAQDDALHAKLVIPPAALERFLETCGTSRAALSSEQTLATRGPAGAPAWWNPPDEGLLGAVAERGDRRVVVAVLPRDTDFVVFVHAAGR